MLLSVIGLVLVAVISLNYLEYFSANVIKIYCRAVIV